MIDCIRGGPTPVGSRFVLIVECVDACHVCMLVEFSIKMTDMISRVFYRDDRYDLIRLDSRYKPGLGGPTSARVEKMGGDLISNGLV